MTRLLLTVYLLMCCIIYLAQDWMAFPGYSDQGKAETQIRYGGDAEIVHVETRSGIPITAVFGKARRPDGLEYSAADHQPTVLYFYGNAGSAAYSQGEFDHFRNAGCNVLIPDLPGYGQSGGKPSESNFYAAADVAWEYLRSRPDVDMSRIIVVGWSMGAGVAIDLAHRKPVMGLATFNAYTSLTAMGRKLMPWFPTSVLLKYRFDNLTKISSIHCPMFICNGRLDTLVPPEMSDRLAHQAGGRVTRVVIDSADHNSIFSAQPTLLWGEFGSWINGLSQ